MAKELKQFIEENRKELQQAILRACPNNQYIESYSELRLWVLNNEGLYNWARSEGVRI